MSERVHRARRAFLKTVGLAAAALPFYKMLENDVVRAQTGTLPQKLVGVGMFHATTQTFYARRAGETDTSFDISYADSCLRPFDDAATYGSSFRDHIIVFEYDQSDRLSWILTQNGDETFAIDFRFRRVF